MTEKEMMLTSLLGCRRVDLYINPETLDTDQSEQLRGMEERRSQGYPLQYIIGTCEFMGLTLKVDTRVLIPRPETELLAEAVLEKARSMDIRHLKILDLGTGSGNIAIALAKYIPGCSITAVDVSEGALELARVNAKMNAVDGQITFLKSDLFSALESPVSLEKFDILVSNPPYVRRIEISSLPLEVQREPVLALDGGEDGLDFYRRILRQATRFIQEDGFLFLEIGETQKESLEKIIFIYPGYKLVEFRKDLCARDRMVVIKNNRMGRL